MKLPFGLLQKFIELPVNSAEELRPILDDLGLEVKDLTGNGEQSVFNIETLANRGDHLHAMGVARELSARYLSPLKMPAVLGELSDRKASLPVKNLTEKCLRYALAELTLPEKMATRSDIAQYLGEAGGNHPLVDLLNYVQLEVGQPMHAFDKDKVEGEISVELSQSAEKITALDGKEYTVPPQSLLIKDKKKILAVAGVIGCANSMVDEQTRRVLIEAATFDPVTVRKTAKGMALSTDASYAFERGVDIESVTFALRRLLYLCSASGSGQDGVHLIGATMLDSPQMPRSQIDFDLAVMRRHLNLPRLDTVEIMTRLKNLGFQIQPGATEKIFRVSVPSWRVWDVKNPEDLYEEVTRTLSFSRVKLELPPLDYVMPETSPIEKLLEMIEPSLVGNGFYEVITKAFYSLAEVNAISSLDTGAAAKHIAIKNAVDGNYSHLKTTNIIHFARLAEQNHRKGILAVKVYELGRIFQAQPQKDHDYQFERDYLSFAASGRWNENEWQKPETREQMLLAFKGVLESLARALGHTVSITESTDPLLHPGFQGAVKLGRIKCGVFGMIHPALKASLDLKQDLFYCQLDAHDLIRATRLCEYTEASEFPAVRRDITLKLPANYLAAKAFDHIKDIAPDNLQRINIVDSFKKVDEEFRRVTYRLTFQSLQKTLESAEVDAAMQQVIRTLDEKHHLQIG